MSKAEAEAARLRIMRTCEKIIAEFDQCLRDIAWWNANRTECPPMDPEPFRVHGMISREVLRLAEERQPIPDELYRRWCHVRED